MSEEEARVMGELEGESTVALSGRSRSSDSRSMEPNRNELHCTCRQPYDPNKFYVACDSCSNWFHGECVGVDPVTARTLPGWTCSACKGADVEMEQSKEFMTSPSPNTKSELFCVCRTEYDESQFYVGCDSCEGWFHPACVGITQTDAENMNEFHCPPCQTNLQDLTRHDYPRLWALLDAITPSSSDESTSINLRPVHQRLERMDYHRLGDLRADVLSIFSQAGRGLPKPSPAHSKLESLQSHFQQLYSQLEETLKSEEDSCRRSPRRSRGLSESSRASAGGNDSFFPINHSEFE